MHNFPIYYDDQPPIEDFVSIAVAPVDAFSGRIIPAGLDVKIEGLVNRPRRNLSGLQVFVNLPAQPSYEININARKAGYFDIVKAEYPPAVPSGNEPRFDVLLHRRPEFPFDSDTTNVRGRLVYASGDPVVNGMVRADLPTVPAGTPPFETYTDEKGSFALPLRMPDNLLPGDLVTFTFSIDGPGAPPPRGFGKPVRAAVQNAFKEDIELDGVNQPDLEPFVGLPVP